MSTPCFRCGEPVLPGEEAAQGVDVVCPDGMIDHHAWHEECAVRAVIGSAVAMLYVAYVHRHSPERLQEMTEELVQNYLAGMRTRRELWQNQRT